MQTTQASEKRVQGKWRAGLRRGGCGDDRVGKDDHIHVTRQARA
jgi:hypothetical protein